MALFCVSGKQQSAITKPLTGFVAPRRMTSCLSSLGARVARFGQDDTKSRALRMTQRLDTPVQ